jgi:hypothetical protein
LGAGASAGAGEVVVAVVGTGELEGAAVLAGEPPHPVTTTRAAAVVVRRRSFS